MKTFVTIITLLFTSTLIAFYTAGAVSQNIRISKEVYEKEVRDEIEKNKEAMLQAEEALEKLQAENGELKSTIKSLETKKGTVVKKTATVPTKTTTVSSSKIVLTAAVVAKHSASSDCWLIINSNVYSVASYISMHPGGRSTITNQCGKDASTAFANRGGTGKHSSSAWSLLNQYLVGKIGSTL